MALLFLDHGKKGVEGSASRPGRSLRPGRARYPLYRRLGGPQDRSGQTRKISPQPGFNLLTVQPVASRCTDYTTRPLQSVNIRVNLEKFVWYILRSRDHSVVLLFNCLMSAFL
jgi:hypothetical protein